MEREGRGDGWYVRVRSHALGGVMRYFADKNYDSAELALAAALKFRDKVFRQAGLRAVEGEKHLRRR